jgi:hypothetical protein
MQYQRGDADALGLVDEAKAYLAGHWTPTSGLSLRRVRRSRARSATWNLTAGLLVVGSIGVYVCGLIFLIHLI